MQHLKTISAGSALLAFWLLPVFFIFPVGVAQAARPTKSLRDFGLWRVKVLCFRHCILVAAAPNP